MPAYNAFLHGSEVGALKKPQLRWNLVSTNEKGLIIFEQIWRFFKT